MTLSVSDKAKGNAKSYVELCYPDWLKNANHFYHLVSFPSRTLRLLTRQSWLKTGLPSTAMNLLVKTDGHQTRRTFTLSIVTSRELYAWTLQDISSQANELWWTDWTEESLTVNKDQLPQDSINKAILSFTKRQQVCVKGGTDIQNVLWEKNCSTTLNIEHNKWLSISSA